MARDKLPHRRFGVRTPIEFIDGSGQNFIYNVTFNLGPAFRVTECFLSHDRDSRILKSGTLLRAILEDGCKLISLSLQHGMSMAAIVNSLGESRPEGQKSGPPSSPLGAIARAGSDIDRRAEEQENAAR